MSGTVSAWPAKAGRPGVTLTEGHASGGSCVVAVAAGAEGLSAFALRLARVMALNVPPRNACRLIMARRPPDRGRRRPGCRLRVPGSRGGHSCGVQLAASPDRCIRRRRAVTCSRPTRAGCDAVVVVLGGATCATSPACGERSDSKWSAGIRVRGRCRESELVGTPPHPTCCASQGLRSQVDLSPHAGRGGASGIACVLNRDDFSSNRHLALAYCWSMIFYENRLPLFGVMIQNSRRSCVERAWTSTLLTS